MWSLIWFETWFLHPSEMLLCATMSEDIFRVEHFKSINEDKATSISTARNFNYISHCVKYMPLLWFALARGIHTKSLMGHRKLEK